MTITFTTLDGLNPLPVIGPWLKARASSDFIGPFPTNSTWSIRFTSDADGLLTMATGQVQSVSHQVDFQWGTTFQGFQWATPAEGGVTDGTPISVRGQVQDPSGSIIDSGVQQIPYSGSTAIGAAPQLVQQGFTDADRATMQVIESWTALDTFITSLAVQDLGVSPIGGSIAAELPTWIYGVIIRMTTVDPTLTTSTPDLDYWVKTLAVLRVFRGTDVLSRVPIHRSSQIVPFTGNGMALQIAGAEVELWAPGLSIEVDFLANCAGQVLLMKLP